MMCGIDVRNDVWNDVRIDVRNDVRQSWGLVCRRGERGEWISSKWDEQQEQADKRRGRTSRRMEEQGRGSRSAHHPHIICTSFVCCWICVCFYSTHIIFENRTSSAHQFAQHFRDLHSISILNLIKIDSVNLYQNHGASSEILRSFRSASCRSSTVKSCIGSGTKTAKGLQNTQIDVRLM